MPSFGTAGIRGRIPDDLDHLTALRVGVGVAATAPEDAPTVVVGRDARITGRAMTAGLTAGLTWAGADVRDGGMVPTPAVAHASRGRHGVMVTASHNPPADNGLKVFADGTEVDPEREAAIERATAAADDTVGWTEAGGTRPIDALAAYLADVRAYLAGVSTALGRRPDDPLDGLAVATDGGNGVAGAPASSVLRDLGASVRAVGANPDGSAPGRGSKPTPASLGPFRRWLADRASGDRPVDLGVAFDGDGDRLVVLGGDGTVIHEDTVLAVVARALVRLSEARDPVVLTTPNASARVDDQVVDAGGRVERAPLGDLPATYRRLAGDGDHPGEVVFASEPWKPVFPGHGPWIDAIAAAGVVALLVADAGGIEALTADVAAPPYAKEAVTCPPERVEAAMRGLPETLAEAFPSGEVSGTPDGVRVAFDRFDWLLVRPSGTEPVLRLYAEGERTVERRLPRAIELLRDRVTDDPD